MKKSIKMMKIEEGSFSNLKTGSLEKKLFLKYN